MLDYTNKIFTNSLKLNLKDVVKSGKFIVSILTNEDNFPAKLKLKDRLDILNVRSFWALCLNNGEIIISNYKAKESTKRIPISLIEKIDLDLSKGFNNTPGPYITKTISFEIKIQAEGISYQLVCEDLKSIPKVLKWVNSYGINYTDSHNLMDLYEKMDEKKVIETLYENIDKLKDK